MISEPFSGAMRTIVKAVRDYLPPDGISKDEFINIVIEATDNPEINGYMWMVNE